MATKSNELFPELDSPNDDFILVWLDTRTANTILAEETVQRQT